MANILRIRFIWVLSNEIQFLSKVLAPVYKKREGSGWGLGRRGRLVLDPQNKGETLEKTESLNFVVK